MLTALFKKHEMLYKNEYGTVTRPKVFDTSVDRYRAVLLAKHEAMTPELKAKYPEIDGIDILGVMRGVFFVPDGKSVNDRFYPRTFWEAVLANPEVIQRLEDRVMFGTIGHEDKYIDDMDLRLGVVSHIVTKLWIDEDTGLGMGEALILGTDTGKNLYRYLKAKSKIKISSRAYGDYVQGKFYQGMPVMDENTYRLEGFDVVLYPGFNETKLELCESASREDLERNKLIVESVIKRRSEIMSGNKQISKQETKPESSLTSELRRSRAKAESQNLVYEKQIQELKSELEEVKKERDSWKEEGTKLFKSYSRYNQLGTVKDLSSKIAKLESYEAISSDPEEIKKTMSEAVVRINKGKELLAMVSEADSALDDTKTALNQYMEAVGTVAEARRNKVKMERALKQYTAFGSVSDVAAMHEKVTAMQAKLDKEKMERDCRKYSVLTGQSIETVQSIFESSKSKEDAIKLLNTLKAPKQKSESAAPVANTSEKKSLRSSIGFKKESVIDSKNNKVLQAKHESNDSADIVVAKSVLRRSISA